MGFFVFKEAGIINERFQSEAVTYFVNYKDQKLSLRLIPQVKLFLFLACMKKFNSLLPLLFIVLLSACASKKKRIENSSFEGADSLTQLVIEATNGSCWDSSTVIQWTFANNKHLWDRDRNLYRLENNDEVILLDLNNPQRGKVYEEGKEVEFKPKKLQKAYDTWANDSYWLNPFWKFNEAGVNRKKYTDEDGKTHLLIYYQNGDKVGDLYDWTIGKDHLPTQWNLFVKIVPINDFKFTWDDWVTLDCGLKISTKHESVLFDIQLKDIEVIADWGKSQYKSDPFKEINVQ